MMVIDRENLFFFYNEDDGGGCNHDVNDGCDCGIYDNNNDDINNSNHGLMDYCDSGDNDNCDERVFGSVVAFVFQSVFAQKDIYIYILFLSLTHQNDKKNTKKLI
jgi:hypothetical protein